MSNTNPNNWGRPQLPENEKRNKEIKFSVTKTEYDFLKKHAQAAGHKQLARFLRIVLFEVVENGEFTYTETSAVNDNVRNAIIGACNNLNQSQKSINSALTHGAINQQTCEAHIGTVDGLVAMMHQVLFNLDPVYRYNAIRIQAGLNNGEDVWQQLTQKS